MPRLSSEAAQRFRQAFFDRCPGAAEVMGLFDQLPSVHFFAKDASHRYVAINRATLVDVFGLEQPEQLIGRTDTEFQPPALAEAYHAEDRAVMQAATPIPGRVWLVPHVRGTPRWYVCSKTPLRDLAGEVIGLAGAMYRVETPEDQRSQFGELTDVVTYLESHFTEELSMADVAKANDLSATRFNELFQSMLRMSPTQYVLALRIEHARQMLVQTDRTIADIGVAVGFYDQSHFTKRFGRQMGLTPLAYRKRFRISGA